MVIVVVNGFHSNEGQKPRNKLPPMCETKKTKQKNNNEKKTSEHLRDVGVSQQGVWLFAERSSNFFFFARPRQLLLIHYN